MSDVFMILLVPVVLFGWFYVVKYLRAAMSNVNINANRVGLLVAGLVTSALVFATSGTTQAQGDVSISVDLTPFFDGLNTYLPIFLTVFGIVGGIAAAIVLSRFIINSVISAFNGGRI